MTILEKNLEKVVAKGGIKSKADAMVKAGYSSRTARSPKKVKIWAELLDKYLPDDKLLKVHNAGLSATKVITSPTEPDSEVTDYMARAKYLELGYKVKGRLQPDVQVNTQNNFLSDDQFKRITD